MSPQQLKRMPKQTELPREMQIKTQDLTLGMYVTRLGTSSAFEGMALEAPEDIVRLQSQCDHVFIDPDCCDRYAFLLIPLSVEP